MKYGTLFKLKLHKTRFIDGVVARDATPSPTFKQKHITAGWYFFQDRLTRVLD